MKVNKSVVANYKEQNSVELFSLQNGTDNSLLYVFPVSQGLCLWLYQGVLGDSLIV